MASNQAPVVDRIRIIPRPDDFLDRNFGNSGEVFFDKQSNTLRLYTGKVAGGYSVLTSGNIAEHLYTSGVGIVEYAVTVQSGNHGAGDHGNVYNIDGEYKPQLSLVVGFTYIFNQDDQTNEYFPNAEGGALNQHPLNFSADNANGELGGGTVYEDNVVYKLDNDPVTKDQYWTGFAAATQRSVQITVTSETPTTLYYWCQQHTGMGNIIETANPGTGAGGASVEVSDTAPDAPESGNIWLDSSTGKLYVYVEDGDSNQWIQPTVPVNTTTVENAFSSVTVSDSTQLYATGSDVLNFVGGPGIIVSTDSTQNTIIIEAEATDSGVSADPEYNNGAIIDLTGDGSDFFKREVTTNGVRIVAAGAVGGQTAVPDAFVEKVARMFELFTDVNGAGINEASQRTFIKTLSGDAGTYHAAVGPTLQRVARGAGSDYTPNFLTDSGIASYNLSPLFDSHVANDMVWYLNSTGGAPGDGDNDAQEVIEHVFHTLHMHGLDAVSLKMYSYITADWATGPLYAAMEEAYDAGKWDSSGYGGNAWKTDGDAFEVAAKEYLFLLNFGMFEYSSLWDGGSLSPEWTDDMRTQSGIQANNPLGYALHNTYIAPVISKPSLTTIRSIFQDGDVGDPTVAGASGYVVDGVSGGDDSASIGNFILANGIIDTDDSSGITLAPSVTAQSDLTVENDLTVDNKITTSQLIVSNFNITDLTVENQLIVNNGLTTSEITTNGVGPNGLTSASTLTLEAADSVQIIGAPFRLPIFTTAEKGALIAVNGDMIYDSDLNKAQVYENGAWASLV